MSKRAHRRTGTGGMGRWRGWDRQGVAPVEVRHVEPTSEAVPMTAPQAKLLKRLCEQHGETFNPSWSKQQASVRIGQLKARRGR
jgi:Protein of unknown function (DUF3072)